MDFKGKGYVEVADIVEAKFVYRMPFPKEVCMSVIKSVMIRSWKIF